MKQFLLILILAVAVPIAAQLVVETTVVPVTASELIEISILDDQLGGLRAVIVYNVLTDTGEEWKPQQVLRFTLDTPDTAQLNGFINATVLPAVNAAEGL